MKRTLLLFVLLISVSLNGFAQKHNIAGKVLDETGVGYPGASVSVKGTVVGTVTDLNGDFNLDVPDGKNKLLFQALGYNPVTVSDTGQTEIIIHLVRSSHTLEGAVVTALGIKREKRELGYSSTTLSNDELTSGQGSSALSDLAGKVAGANITSSTGGPGGSTRVVLRGEKSILKNNNALIVIDGVITSNYDRTQSSQLSSSSELTQVDFGNSANDIDPDEIESMTVLEGPAAAALYGPQGANGAIMITTKSGKHKEGTKRSKLDITYKATYTQSDVLKLPSEQSQFGQGSIYTGIIDDRQDNFSWGLPFDGSMKPWGQVIDGKQLVKPWNPIKNDYNSFFQHGKDLNNFVSLAGGSENSTFYLSINALNSTGIVPNTFYNKYSVRFNATTQLSNNFYTSINMNYMNTYSRAENSGQSAGGVMQSLLQIPTDIPIYELRNLSNKFYSMDYTDAAGVQRYGYFNAYAKNPYWSAQNYDNRNKSDRILGDMNIGYKKGEFNVYNRVGIDVADDRSYYKTPQFDVMPTDQTGLYPGNNYISSGGYAQNTFTNFNFYNDLIATWIHEFNKNFGINALAGNNVTMQNAESLTANIDPATNGLVLPGFYNFQNNQGPVAVTNSLTQRRTYGVYGDVKLNYKRELFVEVTARNEWSSTLAPGHNSYFYPGVNGSWVFTERLKGALKEKVLNYGKIRVGSASVGSDGLAYANNNAGYKQLPVATAFGSVVPPFNGTPAYQIGGTFGDQNLKPEMTRENEVGTDLSFLKDRLSLSFTYYSQYTHDLITALPVPPSTGFAFQYVNVGDITNKGEELSIRGTPISTKWGLKWDLFGTYTHNVNNVVSLTGGVDQVNLGGFNGMAIVAAVGHPYGTFYANDIQYWNGHAVVDANGLPVPTTKAVYRGTYLPKFQASWGTDVTYKGIKLHVLFVTKQGGQYFSETKMLEDFDGNAPETVTNNRNPYVWNNSVQQVGNTNNYVTNTTKFIPYNYWVNEVGQNALPAQGLVNASYIKLQEIALSYKIPTKYYKNTPFGGLEAGVFGNNLIIWTPKSNVYDDPEETSAGSSGNGQGFNFNARPSLRNYGGFIKVTF